MFLASFGLLRVPDQPSQPEPATKLLQPGHGLWRWVLLGACIAACLSPAVSIGGMSLHVTVAGALAMGLLLAIFGLAPKDARLGRWAKLLMQTGVVLMGLSMDLRELAKAGLVGITFAAGTIVGTMLLGAIVGRLLKCEDKLIALLSAGTAICGGSAIAAVGSVIAASQAQMAVAMGTVFLLNAVGLYIFPWLGHAMAMSQEQFGTWAAVAIHDVSSVVGAASSFDRRWFAQGPTPDKALQVAAAVKLSRALWIAPVSIVCAWYFARLARSVMTDPGQNAQTLGKKPRIAIPWFVLWFVVAAALGTYLPVLAPVLKPAALGGKKCMAVALLLIGCGLSLKAIAGVGWRAITLGLVLWVCISIAALLVVRATIQ